MPLNEGTGPQTEQEWRAQAQAQVDKVNERFSGNMFQDAWDDLRGKNASKAAEEAAATQAEAYGLGVDEQRRQFETAQENMAPWLEAGQGALGLQQDFLGLGGEGAQADAYANYQESPGQKFLRERGEKAIVRQHAAIGGLGGSGVRSALNRQGIGVAAQDFGNYYNRLAGMSGSGQTAASGLGNLGMNAASNIGNLAGLQGNARASGILGGAQARQQGIGNVVGLGSMVAGGAPFGSMSFGGGGSVPNSGWGTNARYAGGLTHGTANKIASYDFSGY